MPNVAMIRDALPVLAHELHSTTTVSMETTTMSVTIGTTETILITYDGIDTKTFPTVDSTTITASDLGVSVQSGFGSDYNANPTSKSYEGTDTVLTTVTTIATTSKTETLKVPAATATVTLDAFIPTSGIVAPEGSTASAAGAETSVSVSVPAEVATQSTSTVTGGPTTSTTHHLAPTSTTTVTASASTTSGGTASSAASVRDGLSGLAKVFMLGAMVASAATLLSMPLI